MARHMIHVSETLTVALHSLQGLKTQQENFAGRYVEQVKSSSNSKSNFHFQLQLLGSLLSRSESNKARLQNEITLAFNAEAQRDSKVQVRIAEEARKKTASMKAIAVVTMIFLPSTFVAPDPVLFHPERPWGVPVEPTGAERAAPRTEKYAR
ncbi:MAG: hypothetical protein Q9185_005163 [Variospora sp. 1 TL-2023]